MPAHPTLDPPLEERTADELLELLDEKFLREVVVRALEHRPESKKLRRRKRDALRQLRIDGFKDPSVAPTPKLLQPVLKWIMLDPELARTVLNVWADARAALRDRAVEHLARLDVSAPEPLDARFDAFWTEKEWREERAALAAADDAVDPDSAGLMLCILAQRFPAPPRLESPLFRGWIERMEEIPPDDFEWEEADVFVMQIEDVRSSKKRELLRERGEAIEQLCRSLREQFDEELRYLDIDPDPWPRAIESRPALLDLPPISLGLLMTSLEEYRPIRPQALSRTEELERAEQREELEETILLAARMWEEGIARFDSAKENAPAPETDAEAAIPASPEAESGPVPEEVAALRSERERLEEENRALRAEKAEREAETEQLREELSRSRERRGDWTFLWESYIGELRRVQALLKRLRELGEASADEEPAPDEKPVRDVREAIARARKTFPDRLVVRLNSRSDENTPFAKPEEVFNALAWLATAHRSGRTESIAEVCPGWSYKPSQSDSTMGKYENWYQTTVDGTSIQLPVHVGKGTDHDPRHTIRIACALDKPNDRVVVGFVGQHQPTRRGT